MSFAADKARGAARRARRAARAFVSEPEPAIAPPSAPARPGGAIVDRLADRDVPIEDRLTAHGPLLREYAALLTDDEERELIAELTAEEHGWLDPADPLDRRVNLMGRAIGAGRFGLRERANVSAAMPPGDIHAMTHSEWATGGDPWYADMIDTALRECGLDLQAQGARVLDFGCSSGRVVRMLAARRPQAEWYGCDVNAEAISWAREALPGITFLEQPLRPPLALDDGALDAVYAISIWSHYAAAPAERWLGELHRLLRPGGLALVTTHGAGAIAYRSMDPNHGEANQLPVVTDLYRSGFSFVDAFGEAGDWGVVDREWGVSFIDPEWMLRTITPQWSVALYRPAAIGRHQDLWVLRREP